MQQQQQVDSVRVYYTSKLRVIPATKRPSCLNTALTGCGGAKLAPAPAELMIVASDMHMIKRIQTPHTIC